MNIFAGQGNLCTDVRLRTTATGKEVASFKLAINRPGKDAGADFVWVKVWNGSAVACNTYLKKGSPVLVDGSIRTSRTGEGSDIKEYVEVNARQVTFLSRGNGSNGENGAPPLDENVPEAVVATAAPATAAVATPAPTAAPATAVVAETAVENEPPVDTVDEDDIPF
jgi:single-strand DNA-binding protein